MIASGIRTNEPLLGRLGIGIKWYKSFWLSFLSFVNLYITCRSDARSIGIANRNRGLRRGMEQLADSFDRTMQPAGLARTSLSLCHQWGRCAGWWVWPFFFGGQVRLVSTCLGRRGESVVGRKYTKSGLVISMAFSVFFMWGLMITDRVPFTGWSVGCDCGMLDEFIMTTSPSPSYHTARSFASLPQWEIRRTDTLICFDDFSDTSSVNHNSWNKFLHEKGYRRLRQC